MMGKMVGSNQEGTLLNDTMQSKVKNGVNPAHYKELLCIIKLVLGTEMHGLKFLLITKEIWML